MPSIGSMIQRRVDSPALPNSSPTMPSLGLTRERVRRSASSTAGENWRWGATWTLPADSAPRVGLYAGGGSDPATVAQFESVTFSAVEE